MLLIAVVILSCYLFYLKCVKPLYYWDSRGVPNKRGWPIFGKQAPLLFRTISPTDWMKVAYQEFPGKRYNGNHQFNRPVIIVRDPELIKQITVKLSDYFVNRIDIISKELDPYLGNSLLFLHDQEWKNMRSTLSPAFTSSKMRAMFHLMVECAEGFNKCFGENVNGASRVAVDMKDLSSRFTNDVIASCAFGVTCNSLKYKNNEFYNMGKSIVNFGWIRILKFFGYSIIPTVMKFLQIPVFPKKVNIFFKNLLLKNIKHREDNNVVRPDMLHLLLQAKHGQLKHDSETANKEGLATTERPTKSPFTITNDDIVSQGLLFFFGGLDPTSTTISSMAYELALHLDIQEKLIAEIDKIKEVNYENVMGNKYLDMVVSETLRKWPNVPVIQRVCNKEFVIPAERPDEKDLLVEKGQGFIIPTFGIHYDENYYVNPEKFDPERFSDENKDFIKPYTYFPFGLGPRNCIGSRFALLTIKTFFVVFFSKYRIEPIDRTMDTGRLRKTQLNMAPEFGFWVGIVKRKDKEN